ncbi:hypothetical protein QR685DRAFT_438516, partial [Neurospora intermedia]
STPYTSLVSTPHPVPSSASSSKTNTNSRATNRRHIQQYSSSTGPYYDSDMDLAIHGLHIVDSSHLHPGYKPRRRDAAPHDHHHHQESAADKMSSSSSSSSASTPSPTRLPPFSNSSMNNNSSSAEEDTEEVPRKWGVQSYPSLKQRVREEREERDVRRFPGAAKGGRMESARLQIGTTGYNDEDGGDGDVEMMDVDVLADDGNDWKAAREFERGYDGDTEMGDVPPLSPPPPPSSSHEVKGTSCSGSHEIDGGFGGRRRGSEMPVKLQTEGGNTGKSTTSTGSKKRARGSDQMDEEEEKVEHKRMRSSV